MQQGFAIIELIIVIAVIGILAAMAVLHIGNSVANQELNSAAQQMVTELRYLQQITINASDAASYKMVFNVKEYYIADGITIKKTILLPASVRIYGTPTTMTFARFSGGTSTSQTIQLRSTPLAKSLFIKIHLDRGRVRIDTKPGLE